MYTSHKISVMPNGLVLIVHGRTKGPELEIREEKTEFRKPNPGHDTRFTEYHV